jgi:hypothetical protein
MTSFLQLLILLRFRSNIVTGATAAMYAGTEVNIEVDDSGYAVNISDDNAPP